MSEIKRTGPPRASDVKGTKITWTLPLNAMPGKEWRQFFTQTKDCTVVCNPQGVSLYQSMMVFESREEDVPTWISFIDKWTAAANTLYAEWSARQPRAPGATIDRRDRDQKLVDLNEKFKNL